MAHQITVKWTDSTDTPLDSYNVYWGTATGAETNRANSTPIAPGVGTFTFSAPEVGELFFVVRSVTANGTESVNSVEANATVPLQPPTNVTVSVA